MLEGCDGVMWKYHVRNCASWHYPNNDGIVDLSIAVIRAGLICMLCDSVGDTIIR